MQARLAGNEAEVMLRIQIRNIMAGTSGLAQKDVADTLNQINATKQLLTEKEKIANLVYGGRMGNGPESSGDGAKYCGRGYIQLTGKDNYKAFDAVVPENLLETPEVVYSFQFTREPETLSKIIPKHLINQLNQEEILHILSSYIRQGAHFTLEDIMTTLGKENLEKLEKEKMETLLQNATLSGNKKPFINELKNLFPNKSYPNSWKELEGLQ